MAASYRIGSRGSPLALKQVEEVLQILRRHSPAIESEIISICTYGDKDRITPISQIEGTDFFTKELDDALLNKKIDFAVHSAKDLSDNFSDTPFVAFITKPIDPFDALISKNNLKLHELKNSAKIGTSSLRRKTQLKIYRPDFQIVDIRGNIEERLMILNETDLDAIVLAVCGLLRLNLQNRITQRIPQHILKTHPLQGSLAIVTRSANKEFINLCRKSLSREERCLPETVKMFSNTCCG